MATLFFTKVTNSERKFRLDMHRNPTYGREGVDSFPSKINIYILLPIFSPILWTQQTLATPSHGLSTSTAIVWRGPYCRVHVVRYIAWDECRCTCYVIIPRIIHIISAAKSKPAKKKEKKEYGSTHVYTLWHIFFSVKRRYSLLICPGKDCKQEW